MFYVYRKKIPTSNSNQIFLTLNKYKLNAQNKKLTTILLVNYTK